MSKNISYLSSLPGLKDNLFKAQQEAATEAKSDRAKRALADKSLIGVATIESSTSFYDFLEGENAQKKAYFCNGTACLCAGKQDEVKQQLVKQFGDRKSVGRERV